MEALKNQNGITLFEVLATITILAIITPLIFGVLTNGQKEYNNQSGNNRHLSNITYAMNAITKDMRCNPSDVNLISSSILETLNCDGTTTNLYKFDNSDVNNMKLLLNGTPLLEHIVSFNVSPDPSISGTNYKVTIGYLDKRNNSKNYETSIKIR
ncbi:type II secretion system protein J [Lysinibacillus sp. BW-2-10]|uniref:PulJ/GspJ family protein n=1 Tax=Lysinibacillus sp. BW-2-10 TaxID=2590030 RepID=UPI00117EEC29|nr:type II secretion system protein [Lysinibacillus sp. BW-2-10]TSI10134.1 type II secretion system protein [Lysinibacillus sp. BW-2-10]